MIDDRTIGDDRPVQSWWKCGKCGQQRRTDSARLCCGSKMLPLESAQKN